MFKTFITVVFLVLMVTLIVSAWLVKDRRIHIGVLAIVFSWVTSNVIHMIISDYSPLLVEIIINIALIYIFFQLHFWPEGENSGPVWPVYMMVFELCIFLSHMTRITMSPTYYVILINILFGVEVLFMIGVIWFNRLKKR
ncbi:hypothetical protein [Aquisalinus flavus]|uniref:Uncharacterized protein n=1 Tax=Aquisalinus flavus TaxID=1526572 RepID=A0A8J2V214_9PROT|nr:hypothetical protein [Aquisalinus flavus]MBD0426875.1 hypothetical protein [Aquisalinus flavus]UNE46722.1 hypothetical protein FF099_00925 [Aquisalinus flavus]GGC96663.1 hypothetical protein GCM10011342_01890 [Aquisalinus flavus]